ncbi:MAG TPA: putative sulfate exporter family transporter [Phycisphaerales bacterium]|nr:putative sulfate exporter family transporter [Phycisphaerales bacterium]
MLLATVAYASQYVPAAPFQVVVSGGRVTRPLSPALLAILLGLLVRNLVPATDRLGPGARVVARTALPWSVVLAGASLDLARVGELGALPVLVIVLGILVALGMALSIGAWLRVPWRTGLMVGAGTAICGNNAVIAVAPVVRARDEDVAVCIATVNLCGLLAMIVLPVVAWRLGLDERAFGVVAGASVHSVPQAVATGYAFGPDAGATATLVKLVRVALLGPLVLIIAAVVAGARRDAGARTGPAGLVPWFLWGFVLVAAVRALGWIPVLELGGRPLDLVPVMEKVGSALLTLAMAGIGLDLSLRTLARSGGRAVATGLVASTALAAACFGLARGLLGPH